MLGDIPNGANKTESTATATLSKSPAADQLGLVHAWMMSNLVFSMCNQHQSLLLMQPLFEFPLCFSTFSVVLWELQQCFSRSR